MSLYSVEQELSKCDELSDFAQDKYKGDLAYAIADNPFILEAIGEALRKEFPELWECLEDI